MKLTYNKLKGITPTNWINFMVAYSLGTSRDCTKKDFIEYFNDYLDTREQSEVLETLKGWTSN